MSDHTPKSAYEIALEKLKQRDRESGERAPAALTEEQKKSIAGIRKMFEARVAEREILHRSERAKLLSQPEGEEKLEKVEEEYLRDRRRIEEQRDRAIEAARAVDPKGPRKKGGGPKAKMLIVALGLGLLASGRLAAGPPVYFTASKIPASSSSGTAPGWAAMRVISLPSIFTMIAGIAVMLRPCHGPGSLPNPFGTP